MQMISPYSTSIYQMPTVVTILCATGFELHKRWSGHNFIAFTVTERTGRSPMFGDNQHHDYWMVLADYYM